MFNNRDHGHLSEKELMFLMFDFLISKIDTLMTKGEFIQAITDLKTEVVGIGTKVDTLETAITNAGGVIPDDVAAAFADLKGSVDALNTKADNTPAAPPTEEPAA